MSTSPTPAPSALVPPPFGGGGEIKERLRPLEWVATVAAGSLFLAIVSILIWGLFNWPHGTIPQLAGTAVDTQAITNFKSLTDIEVVRMSKVLDMAITKTLLPVFTTVIGCLLGKRDS